MSTNAARKISVKVLENEDEVRDFLIGAVGDNCALYKHYNKRPLPLAPPFYNTSKSEIERLK